jgi:hypothetical protein
LLHLEWTFSAAVPELVDEECCWTLAQVAAWLGSTAQIQLRLALDLTSVHHCGFPGSGRLVSFFGRSVEVHFLVEAQRQLMVMEGS